MLYAFFVFACLCSNYIIAMQNERDSVKNKVYYDERIAQIKDDKERAKYEKGYIVVADHLIPYSEIQVMVPVGKDGCFMSFPIDDPIHRELEKQAMEKTISSK
jgi:hypothetical protein